MVIHLIRHGKTMANEKHLYCGQTDLPLSELGATAISENKQQGIYPRAADLFFTSGFLRTEQTLNLIYDHPPREVLPQLAEYHFGHFEMKGHADLESRDDYRAWTIDETGHICCPGGESKDIFSQRVMTGFNLLLEYAQQVEAVLAVCHGGVITRIMDNLFPGVRNFYEWQPEPGRGYSLTYDIEKICSYKTI